MRRVYTDLNKPNQEEHNFKLVAGLNQQVQTYPCSLYSVIGPHKNQPEPEAVLLLQQQGNSLTFKRGKGPQHHPHAASCLCC